MRIKCPGCAKVYSLKPELAGKTVKCSACQHKMRIPADPVGKQQVSVAAASGSVPSAEVARSTSSTAATRGAQDQVGASRSASEMRQAEAKPRPKKRLTSTQILEAFEGDIEPVRVSLAYRLVTLIVSCVMLLLPLIYIAIILGVCYGVYYHAVNHTGLLTVTRGRGVVLMFLVYSSVIIVGPIAIAFMVKPLFSWSRRTERERWLNRESEPLLFAFVDRICDAVHAPEPKRIRVDCELNASAGFRRGALSMLSGTDLVLTLGMPLVGGMTMQQFAGVIAHEFGHFSQGTGMRVTYVIRYISHWFARVVYQRDSWDDWLDEVAESLDFRIAWIFYLAKLLVWLTRRVLWLLMVVGHVCAGMLLRQMEYDADRHEARLAGSEGFVSGTRQLRKLGVAYQGMLGQMSDFYREGKLADNLPKLLQATTRHMPTEVIAKLQEAEEDESTGLFDTHPCDRDRIENALREEAAGVFHLQRPASELFKNYDAICKGTTQDYYLSIFGKRLKVKDLKPTEALIKQQDATIAEAQVVDDYFFENFASYRGLRLGTAGLEPPTNAKRDLQQVAANRKRLFEMKEDYARLLNEYQQWESAKTQAEVALAMHRAGTFSRRMPFVVPVATLDEAKETGRTSKRKLQTTIASLEPLEQAAAQRLHLALKLALHPQVAPRIDSSSALQKRTKDLVETLQILNTLMSDYNACRACFNKLAMLLNQLSGNEKNEDYIGEVLGSAKILHSKLSDLRTPLRGHDYPFEHSRGRISLAEYVIGDHPPSDDIGAIMQSAEHFTEAFPTVYRRIVGKLVVVAKRVEDALIKS